MTFIFRCDSAEFIGSGHIRRCLNIAKEIKERGSAERDKQIIQVFIIPIKYTTYWLYSAFEIYYVMDTPMKESSSFLSQIQKISWRATTTN